MVKIALILFFVGVVLGSTLAQDCWWTGCQPNSWAVIGCGQYGRDERGRESCRDGQGTSGFRYNCCEKRTHNNGRIGSGRGPGGGRRASDLVTFSEFSQAVTSNGYPSPSTAQFNNFNRYARANGQISTKQEAAMALAQLLHESDGLRAKREYACEHNNCPNNYRTPAQCLTPGQYYFGRGYIQLTWCDNYKAASSALFNDDRLVRDPDMVARDEVTAWKTAFWYWADRVRNQPGVQQGQFGATTKAINGPLECDRPGHTGPASRFRLYGNVRAAFELPGPGDASGCR